MGSASRWHTLKQWIGKEHGEEERDRVGEEKGKKKKLLSGLPAVVRALPTLIRFSRFFFFCTLHSLLSTPLSVSLSFSLSVSRSLWVECRARISEQTPLTALPKVFFSLFCGICIFICVRFFSNSEYNTFRLWAISMSAFLFSYVIFNFWFWWLAKSHFFYPLLNIPLVHFLFLYLQSCHCLAPPRFSEFFFIIDWTFLQNCNFFFFLQFFFNLLQQHKKKFWYCALIIVACSVALSAEKTFHLFFHSISASRVYNESAEW